MSWMRRGGDQWLKTAWDTTSVLCILYTVSDINDKVWMKSTKKKMEKLDQEMSNIERALGQGSDAGRAKRADGSESD